MSPEPCLKITVFYNNYHGSMTDKTAHSQSYVRVSVVYHNNVCASFNSLVHETVPRLVLFGLFNYDLHHSDHTNAICDLSLTYLLPAEDGLIVKLGQTCRTWTGTHSSPPSPSTPPHTNKNVRTCQDAQHIKMSIWYWWYIDPHYLFWTPAISLATINIVVHQMLSIWRAITYMHVV